MAIAKLSPAYRNFIGLMGYRAGSAGETIRISVTIAELFYPCLLVALAKELVTFLREMLGEEHRVQTRLLFRVGDQLRLQGRDLLLQGRILRLLSEHFRAVLFERALHTGKLSSVLRECVLQVLKVLQVLFVFRG